jgi:predicted DsbA family dithiol-disulfide isomerase
VEHLAFELHPGIPPEGQVIPWPPERMAAARQHFEQVAAAAGLPYGQRTHWYDSLPAHEAALWGDAQDAGARGEELRRAIYRAYFVDDLNIGAPDILARLADGVGLDGEALRAALADGQYRDAVREQFEIARSIGVTGVPAYVAGKYLMIGAQPVEVYRQLIETALRDESESAGTDA